MEYELLQQLKARVLTDLKNCFNEYWFEWNDNARDYEGIDLTPDVLIQLCKKNHWGRQAMELSAQLADKADQGKLTPRQVAASNVLYELGRQTYFEAELIAITCKYDSPEQLNEQANDLNQITWSLKYTESRLKHLATLYVPYLEEQDQAIFRPLLSITNNSETDAPILKYSKTSAQDKAVLDELTKQGYEPKSLPTPPPGKAGPKAAVWDVLKENKKLFVSHNVFRRTWERLLRYKDIEYDKDE